MKITEMTTDEFRRLVESLINEAPKDYFVAEVRQTVLEIIGESHADQHKFIQLLIEEREEKIRRRQSIQDKVAGSLILSTIGGIVVLLGTGAMDWLREHLK